MKRKVISIVIIICFIIAQTAFSVAAAEENTRHPDTQFEDIDQEQEDDSEEFDEADEADELDDMDEINEEDEDEIDQEDEDEIDQEDEDEIDQEQKDELEESKDALEDQKEELEESKDALEDQKEELEDLKESLEEQYEEAKEAGNSELADQLRVQLEQTEMEMDSLKAQIKQAIEYLKETVKIKYTEEELENLQQLMERIRAMDSSVKVLPVENVIAKGVTIKFDTPPVIKEGRTLVPVRALSEAFGAEVEYVAEEQTVVITKGETEIILEINGDTAYVNGVETKLDVPSEVINNRTLVPLRFILESLGLKVNWDNDTQTIEIETEQTVQ